MAIAVDGSTPVRWTGNWTANDGGSITSASFTAPANALLVLCACADTAGGPTAPTGTLLSASDSGGLTWTKQVERLGTDTLNGAQSAIFTARTTSATSRTVTLTGNDPGGTGRWGTGRASALVYVLTGVDVDGTPVDTVGANNEGTSTTNDLTTTSITPGANGLLFCCDTEWNVLGVFTSSDLTIDTADYASEVSVVSGYKTCSSGVGVTGNLNAATAAAAQHKWCQITVREAAGGAVAAKLLSLLGVG